MERDRFGVGENCEEKSAIDMEVCNEEYEKMRERF